MKACQVIVYRGPRGETPLQAWLDGLRDMRTRARVMQRLERLALGQWGDYRSLGGGVHEMRMFFGSGYRVYFAVDGKAVVVLLCGGDKSSQSRDIERAKRYWNDYREQKP